MIIAKGGQRESVAPETLAPQVARKLENEIIQQGWPVGQLLGSETELRERFGVSRSVLREAIRLLEHQLVAQMRHGPGGGLVVCAPDSSPATRALVIYLEYVGTSVGDLHHARLLLEPLAARLATQSVTEEEIARLRATAGPCQPVDADFHVLVGQLSGNKVLQLFTEVLARLSGQYVLTYQDAPSTGVAAPWVHAPARHVEVVDAMLAGDDASAQVRMVAHLTEIEDWLLTHSRSWSSERMLTRPVDPQPGRDPARKGAELLAGRIHDDIVGEGHRVGEVFGSESVLLARYQVGRAMLREAVRILEHHSVAQMRRGHGGGLVVLAPDPTASIHTIGLYLNYQGLRPEHLLVVREALELGCVQAATAAARGPAAAARLRAMLAREDIGEGFHSQLAEIAGNTVLTLFLSIVTRLWASQGFGERSPETTGDGDVHKAILEAVLAGDEGLAQHRMRRHLRTFTSRWH
ncbi:FadR/GntR family transcriptional regulator [Streptomyces sp. NPDC058001]|uniref:FadR/GntR family transcriptional regulator n=1 Tax=Streptomyces sp. NPDC058001 TaxID=3346300 RepID=UPI0036E07FB7